MRMDMLICLLTHGRRDTALYPDWESETTPVCFSLAWAPIWLSSCQLGDFVQIHSPINVCVSAPQLQKGMIALKLLTVQCCYEYSKISEYTWSIYVRCVLMESWARSRRVSFSSCLSALPFLLVLTSPGPWPHAFTSPIPTDLCHLWSVPLSSNSPSQNTAEHLLRIYLRKYPYHPPWIKQSWVLVEERRNTQKLEMWKLHKKWSIPDDRLTINVFISSSVSDLHNLIEN